MEAAKARLICAWAKFRKLSPILTVRGASYHIKEKIYRACVHSVLTYGTETWAMKAENLLWRKQSVDGRWMLGMSLELKGRKRSEDMNSL